MLERVRRFWSGHTGKYKKQRGDFMGELYEPFPKLPKNIRQIGERDQVLRVYVEDYVNTYLKRLQPTKGAGLRVGLLLGSRETREDMPYVFVDGALEMETAGQEGEKVVFHEEAWKRAYEDVERLFPKRTVQGWFICGSTGCSLNPLSYWKQHSQYFTGKNQMMYLNGGPEGEEAIYITSADGFHKLQGYCVYYERNQVMQDYMVLQRDTPRTENGVNDRAAQDFRQKMELNRHTAGRQKNAAGVLAGVCTVLTVTVLAGGVAMFNNYRKMRELESVAVSVLPEIKEGREWEFSDLGGFLSGKNKDEKEDEFSLREIQGNLWPAAETGNSGTGGSEETETASREYAAAVHPETMAASIPEAKSGNERPEIAANVWTAEQSSAALAETAASAQKTEQPGTLPAETGKETLPEAATPPPAASSYRVHQVASGETLYGICFKLYENLSHLDEICRVNGLSDVNSIEAGQKLLVP